MRPILVDAYCRQGGSAEGFRQAGFDVIGIDKDPQPRFPFTFIHGDAIEFMADLLDGATFEGPSGIIGISDIAGFAGGPPCQAFSDCQRIRGREHPKLIEATRILFEQTGKPWIIENVPGARDELRNPIELCGAMFPELQVYRHRLFESNIPLAAPLHPLHVHQQVKMGRPPANGEWVQAVGNSSGVQIARDAMGIQWMNREGLREAIPPAYTRYLGIQMLNHIRGAA